MGEGWVSGKGKIKLCALQRWQYVFSVGVWVGVCEDWPATPLQLPGTPYVTAANPWRSRCLLRCRCCCPRRALRTSPWSHPGMRCACSPAWAAERRPWGLTRQAQKRGPLPQPSLLRRQREQDVRMCWAGPCRPLTRMPTLLVPMPLPSGCLVRCLHASLALWHRPRCILLVPS